jgi:hypothetical protein
MAECPPSGGRFITTYPARSRSDQPATMLATNASASSGSAGVRLVSHRKCGRRRPFPSGTRPCPRLFSGLPSRERQLYVDCGRSTGDDRRSALRPFETFLFGRQEFDFDHSTLERKILASPVSTFLGHHRAASGGATLTASRLVLAARAGGSARAGPIPSPRGRSQRRRSPHRRPTRSAPRSLPQLCWGRACPRPRAVTRG